MKKGFSLIELLIALLVAGLVIGFAVSMLRTENSNMIHVRSRVQSQTAARDGLKIMESELRAAGFGIGVTYSDAANNTLQISGVSTCANLVDATTQSSILAMDGADGGNDTLDMAFPINVNASRGADCANPQWSRYLVVGGDLMRYSASTRAALPTAASPTVVGRNVDVFQVQLGATGISKPGKLLLGADSCCNPATVASRWATSLTHVPDATAKTDELSVTGTWSFLSQAKSLSAGETWRVRLTIESANGILLSDLTTNPTTSFVKMGLYDATNNVAVSVPLLSRPVDAPSGFGQTTDADLVVPTTGNYQLRIYGKSAATGGKLTIRSFDALSVKLGSDSAWFKNPVDMNLDDWTRVKSVRVQILTRAPADKPDYRTEFTGLANYLQPPASTTPGLFKVTDTAVRVLLDHQYPAGNNGKF